MSSQSEEPSRTTATGKIAGVKEKGELKTARIPISREFAAKYPSPVKWIASGSANGQDFPENSRNT